MIPLLYIASIGRSGSTLLESMLGAHSRVATTGEFHIWPHEIRMGGVRPCGCGEFVEDCEFWSEVRRRVDPLAQEGPGLDFFREAHNHGKTIRRERLEALSDKPTEALADQALIEAYGRNNEALFQAFLDVTAEQLGERPDWVVDASKDPYRLAWLARSGRFDIKVIHLVKNPRAFAYSVTKKHIHGENGSPPSSAFTRLYYTARQSTAWTIQNGLFARVARNVLRAEDYLLVQYEELASAPHETFQRVCEMIGMPYEANAVEDFRTGSVHTIAGNPMRYEKRGITLDERWKNKLPATSRWLAGAVGRLTEARYGY